MQTIKEGLDNMENLLKSIQNEGSESSTDLRKVYIEEPTYTQPVSEEDRGDMAMKSIARNWGIDGTKMRQANLTQIMAENQKRFEQEQSIIEDVKKAVPALLSELHDGLQRGDKVTYRIKKAFSHNGEFFIDAMSGAALSGPEFRDLEKSQYINHHGYTFGKEEKEIPVKFGHYLLEKGLDLMYKASYHLGQGIHNLVFEDSFGRTHNFTTDAMERFFVSTERVA